MIALPSKLLVAAICLAGLAPAIAAETPDTENGRYTLQPSGDAMLRLDTRTGTVSNCTNSGTGWACYAVPDERAALDTEIGRLEADNEKLKAQLAARDQAQQEPDNPKVDGPKISEALPKTDSLKPLPQPKVADGERKIQIPRIEIPMPSDRDMDRMMSALEQAWR